MKSLLYSFLFLGILLIVTVQASSISDFEKVQKLGLSYKDFLLGEKLPEAEDLTPLKGALKGTRRYRKGSLILAVDEKTRHLLALYDEYLNLKPKDVQKLVGELVARFGEPTFEAHEKMLFWYFTSKGKISSEAFKRLREEGKKPEVVAIAKFYCDQRIVEFGNSKDSKAKARAYFTLYSPLLIRKFVYDKINFN